MWSHQNPAQLRQAPVNVPDPDPMQAPATVPNPDPGQAPVTVPDPDPGQAPLTVPNPKSRQAPVTVPDPDPGQAPVTAPNPDPGQVPVTAPNPKPSITPVYFVIAYFVYGKPVEMKVSTEDAISLAVHSSLEYVDNKDTYIRLLLIDYRSTFNTIIPSTLISKLHDLGLGSALCNWILSFLTHRQRLRKFDMSIRTLINFYRCTTESILSGFITAWYGNCSAQDCKKLQKVACTAQTITETNLPSMSSIYMAHCCRKVANIIKDPSHP
eukprot:g36814.t1